MVFNFAYDLLLLEYYFLNFYNISNVRRKTNKVDRAKRMHCVRSERAIAVTLVVRRLWRQSACAQGNRISAECVRLALSTLFVSLFTRRSNSRKHNIEKWLRICHKYTHSFVPNSSLELHQKFAKKK
jgi:hypothetical protein